jgi:hypothetical protein
MSNGQKTIPANTMHIKWWLPVHLKDENSNNAQEMKKQNLQKATRAATEFFGEAKNKRDVTDRLTTFWMRFARYESMNTSHKTNII